MPPTLAIVFFLVEFSHGFQMGEPHQDIAAHITKLSTKHNGDMQSMAYGLLASVDAINGLYVSFFPVLIYFLMGTSRHISVGTFAVVSMMLSSTIEKLETVKESNALLRNDTVISSQTIQTIHNDFPTNIEVLTTVSLVTGGMQLLMGILHLGTLTVLLSDNLVSGFSTGAAVHVATSQMKDLFDINIGKYNGPFKLIYVRN
ncbi:solute carrier family 26 member 6-like [Centruroides sculpturatus]|uniref:solute carrier family 26 member 6-like n=1 Tax=Centruroides sculpturatus TaxID=218467 RepID=UPI000C6DBE15|nr:solute carrier family 26 member 6-like [Centruroides sculpturatus]